MDKREKIRQFVERAHPALDQVDYYRLLNISSGSSSEEIQLAYYRLAASLHPDVHGIAITSAYKEKLTLVFSRVVEAYKVLSEHSLRERYDRGLAKGFLRIQMGTELSGNGPDIEVPNALKFYKLGKSALDDGNYKMATMNFRFALQLEPGSESIQEALALAEKG